jgi:hypothetical protein
MVIEQALAQDSNLCSEFLTHAGAATQQRDSLADLLGPSLGEFRLRLASETASVYFE